MPKYDNSGALFKNDKEGGNPKWPDYKGQITVDGVEYWLSAWIKKGEKGTFMSLSVKPKDKQSRPAAKRAPIDSDNIPFDRPFRGMRCYAV